ncbi:MAG: hypothetical protein QOJ38_952 [Solirubrobacterales bacterium]|jgi:hypothetical protein|nr:hypothetical protein [Solirubrobacterales bacterium]
MLFDLRGKRKRAIQVIYAGLAILMGGGLVLFGIGSSANGGLLDALGIGGNNASQPGANYDTEAAKLERKLKLKPNDPTLLLQLARTRILAGNTKSPSNSTTGQVTYSQASLNEFQQAADAWESYLKAVKGRPSSKSAILVAQTYIGLAQNERSVITAVDDIKGAARAQEIYAKTSPSLGSLSQLAIYQYLAGDAAVGDVTAKKAVAKADASNREVLKTRLKQARKQGLLLKKQVKKAAKTQGTKDQLQHPLGGLSGGGAGGGLLNVPAGSSP